MNGTLSIRRLLLVQTGTYDDMYRRSYRTHVDGRILNNLQEVTNQGQVVNATALASVAGQLIIPSSEGSPVQIVNGWDTVRFRFIMEVVSNNYQGGEIVQYVCGYTDHFGLSASGHLDPRMQFYINSIVTTRRVMGMSSLGTGWQQRVTSADHLLINNTPGTGFTMMNNSPHRMAPEDVFWTMGLSSLGSGLDRMADGRTVISHGKPKKSRRSNAVPSHYLSKILDVHKKSMLQSQQEHFTDDQATIMENAASSVAEELATRDMFLQNIYNNSSFLQQGCWIGYQDLLRLAPHLETVTTVVRPKNTTSVDFHMRGQSMPWSGTTTESIIATVLTHAVPGIMMDLMLTKVVCKVTNRTLDGSVQSLLGDVRSFAGSELDLAPYAQTFLNRFKNEVFADISKNNQIDLDLEMTFDVAGETSLKISVQGQPHVPFVAASFSDAQFTPIWANDSQTLRTLSFEIGTVCCNLEANHHQQYAPNAPQTPSPYITQSSHDFDPTGNVFQQQDI